MLTANKQITLAKLRQSRLVRKVESRPTATHKDLVLSAGLCGRFVAACRASPIVR